MMPPRIRGRLAQIAEPPEDEGKWVFEISMWTFDGEKELGPPFGPFGPFDTEDLAAAEMMRACQMAAEAIEIQTTGEVSGKYLDMKNGGVLRPWREQ
jgi:hypothetical protein